MKKYLSILRETKMFSVLGDDEILSMTGCLKMESKRYEKGGFVFRQGDLVRCLAILAKGRLVIQKEDYWGNLNIQGEVRPKEMFGASMTGQEGSKMMNNVMATEESEVLLFDMDRILNVCPSACPYHARLIKNLFYAISEKNKILVQKIGYLSQRTTRQKLLSYLSDEAVIQNSSSITIPYNRQQLADYLSVDRSAMSSELGKMRDEGILDFHKNKFAINKISE